MNMNIWWNGKDLIAFGFLGLLFLALILFVWIPSIWKSFWRWRRSGFCKHEWKLYNTHSMGPGVDYKCTKCGQKRTSGRGAW